MPLELMDIVGFFLPPLQLYTKNRVVWRDFKTAESEEFGFERIEHPLCRDESELRRLYEAGIQRKRAIDAKTTASLLSVAVAIATGFGSMNLASNTILFGGRPGLQLCFRFACSGAVIFMGWASLISIHALGRLNVTHTLPDSEYATMARAIALNDCMNLLRQNFMFTSYACIVRAIVLTVAVFLAMMTISPIAQGSAVIANGGVAPPLDPASTTLSSGPSAADFVIRYSAGRSTDTLQLLELHAVLSESNTQRRQELIDSATNMVRSSRSPGH